MALHEKNNSQGYFFSLKHGGFTLEADKPTEGFTETEVPNPSTGSTVTKWLKTYASIEGKITRIDWYDREHSGTRYIGIKIVIHDGGEAYSIDLPFGKRHYNYFMRVMDSIDYEERVEMIAYGKKDDAGRAYTEFAIKQHGKWVEQLYTRANPGECPAATQDPMGNWDARDRNKWLRDRLINVIIPHVAELNATGDPDDDKTDEVEAFTGSPAAPAAAKAAKAGTVYGTPPEDEKAFEANRKFVDDIPF